MAEVEILQEQQIPVAKEDFKEFVLFLNGN
jgi:hypothetical protein